MRTSLVVAVTAMAVALSALAARAAEPKAADHFPDISVKDLKAAIEKRQVTVIDVNGTDSYKEGHVPGAIDFEAGAEKFEKALPKDKGALVVAYCGGPQCNAYKAAAKKAAELGYTKVRHLSAGISGWKEAGERVEKPASKKAA